MNTSTANNTGYSMDAVCFSFLADENTMFYSSLLSKMDKRPVKSHVVKTLGVGFNKEGKLTLFYNDTFFRSLHITKSQGVLMHEALHVFLRHLSESRFKTQVSATDPVERAKQKQYLGILNVAMDMAINSVLTRNRIPEGCIFPDNPEYAHLNLKNEMETEYYIEKLLEEPPESKPQQCPNQEDNNDQENDQDDQETEDNQGNEDDKGEGEDDQEDSENSEDDGEDDSTNDGGESSEETDEEDGEDENGTGEDDSEGEEDQEEDSGDGEGSDDEGEETEDSNGTGEGEDQHEGECNCSDCQLNQGGMGQTLDTHEFFNKVIDDKTGEIFNAEDFDIDVEYEIADVVKRTIQECKEFGYLPAFIQNEIAKVKRIVKHLWKRELKIFTNEVLSLKKALTNKRRNKRLNSYRINGKQVFFKGRKPGKCPKLVFVVDTSGSMFADDILKAILNELLVLLQLDVQIYVLYCDTVVHETFRLRKEGDLLPWKGGGGTNFIPAFEAAKKLKADGIIYATDTWGTFMDAKAAGKFTRKTIWLTFDQPTVRVPYGRHVNIPYECIRS